MRLSTIGLVCVALLAGGCDGGTSSIFDNRSDAAYSPEGSVPADARAYTQDRYATEVPPLDRGNIGIFDRNSEDPVLQIQALPEGHTNDLKGLAWSPDGDYLAVMYHGGSRPGVTIYDAESGEIAQEIGSVGWHHYMVFSRTGDELLLSRRGEEIDETCAVEVGE